MRYGAPVIGLFPMNTSSTKSSHRGAQGWRVDDGLQPGPLRDGQVIILFGHRPDLIGWPAAREGRPGEELLSRVHHFSRGWLAEKTEQGNGAAQGLTRRSTRLR